MKTTVNLVRWTVGLLFIISGLVKANDPLGLGYKMQEFFEVWNESLKSGVLFSFFTYLHEQALPLSLFMITLEILAGVALLLGWKKKAVLGLLLALIVFFTFLTAFAYWSGKFKNCGCFGDCLPISPLASFLKDLVLLVLILFLLVFQRYIQPYFSPKKTIAALLSCLLITLALQWYVLSYLPLVDCLPFKKGNNIAEQMKLPPNAVPDSFAMKFIYEKGGKRFEFLPEELPTDLASYQFIDREQKLVRKGNAEPAIKGFSLVDLQSNDLTQSILAEPRVLLVFSLNFEGLDQWFHQVKELYTVAKSKDIPFFIVSAEPAKGKVVFSAAGLPDVVFVSCDNTAIKTAARVQPTVFYLEKGTIRKKYGYRNISQLIAQL